MKSRPVVAVAIATTLLAGGVCAGLYARHAYLTAPLPPVHARERRERAGPTPPKEEEDEDGIASGYAFHMPSGKPSSLRCDDAKRIVSQVRTTLAAAPSPVDGHSFVESTSDWLDPHALWSVAPDAPKEAFHKELRSVLPELETLRGSCAAADASGAVLAKWVDELRAAFDKARLSVPGLGDARAAKSPVPGTGDALAAARELGEKVGTFERGLGPSGKIYGDAARDRFFPTADAHTWGELVLSAAVRAYVPIVDPHGAWAPYDEEASVYDVDLSANAPHALWTRSDLTAVGVCITEGPTAPFEVGDVVLSIGELPTAGLPLEQIEQLGFVASDAKSPMPAVVLRGDKLVSLSVGGPEPETGAKKEPETALTKERIAWGTGDVLVVGIHDVRDDLGDDLSRVLREERSKDKRPVSGVVLDLRGNGGGSTDGAMQALGLFMPGVPLFPMKRRDGTIEIERATEPADDERFRGPVATLVDGATASAAEMMAGAFTAYSRGPSLGLRTFGKGCAQEYFDDEPRTGVLRLTTLLYSLPDGSPVQRVGLLPTLEVPFVSPNAGKIADREASLAHAPPTWRGPDMRGAKPRTEPWVPLREDLGECKDADVCSALHVLAEGWPKRAPSAWVKKRR